MAGFESVGGAAGDGVCPLERPPPWAHPGCAGPGVLVPLSRPPVTTPYCDPMLRPPLTTPCYDPLLLSSAHVLMSRPIALSGAAPRRTFAWRAALGGCSSAPHSSRSLASWRSTPRTPRRNTLHLAPCTLHPAPHTPHPTTINPPLNPKP